MSVAQRHVAQQYAGRGGPSGLADVLEVLLDKGLVIDAYVRVSLIGIELLTVDVRVVVASVDTYLRFAEAVNRLDLTQASNAQTLGDLVSGETNSARSRRSNGSDRSRSARRDDEDDGEDEREEERLADDQRGEGEREAEGRDQPEDESAQDVTEETAESDDSDDQTGDESEDDDSGLLSRIKERGQAFSGRSDH